MCLKIIYEDVFVAFLLGVYLKNKGFEMMWYVFYHFSSNLRGYAHGYVKKFCSKKRDQKYQSNILFILNEQVLVIFSYTWKMCMYDGKESIECVKMNYYIAVGI